jgi:hypothetical protein
MAPARTYLDIAAGAVSDYYDWLKQAPAGGVLVYWIGDLQHDRGIEIPETDVLRGDRRVQIATLNVIADRIREDAEEGHLLLTQRRLATNVFEYRATRRRRVFITKEPQRNDDLVLA